jgi:protein involved in polysaccharide export with SLBB domain
VHDPSVTVRLLQQSQLIFLTGATIGTIPYLPGETLASALGQLRQQLEKDYADNLTTSDKNGGTLLRSSIDLRNIVIVRDQRADAPINGEELLRSGQPGPALSPGDTLQLASKPVRVDIKGDVAAPGSIYLYPNDTLEEALLQAGGPLPSASTADASLIRNGKDTPITLAGATLRDVPQNGDIIIVKAAPHVTVLGQVPTPGDYTLKNGSTLLTALYDAGGPTKWANVKDIQVVHNGTRSTYNLDGLTHGDLSTNVPLVDGDVVYVPEGHKIDVTPILQGIAGALSATYNASHL